VTGRTISGSAFGSRSQAGRDFLPGAVAVFAVPLAYYLRFGYRFGYSDQDEFLPWILTRLNPDLLTSDWFLGFQTGAFNVRSVFVDLLTPLAAWVGLETAVMFVQIGAGLALVASILLMARSLGASPTWAAFAPFLVLVLIPRWTIGGNALASSMLVPSTLAWAFSLGAIVLLFRDRPLLSGVLLGLGAWIQILVAAQVGAIGLFALLWRDRRLSRSVSLFAVPAVLLAAPLVFLLVSSGSGVTKDSFAVLASFRAPHHYLPGAFPPGEYVRFGLVLLMGGGAWLHGRAYPTGGSRKPPIRVATGRLLGGLLIGVIAALGLGVLAWMASWEFLLLLQPFKASVLGLAICGTAACAALPSLPLKRWMWAAGLALVILLWARVLGGGRLDGRPPPDPGMGELNDIAAWSSSNTPAQSTFMVPPSTTGFRYLARRAVVVNFKAYPFSDAGMREWLRRLGDMAPGVVSSDWILSDPGANSSGRILIDPAPNSSDWILSEVGGTRVLAPLDSAYESLAASRADSLGGAYAARYLVRRTELEDPDSLFTRIPVPGTAFLYERNTP
jgi:uncharacterized protein DUF6798